MLRQNLTSRHRTLPPDSPGVTAWIYFSCNLENRFVFFTIFFLFHNYKYIRSTCNGTVKCKNKFRIRKKICLSRVTGPQASETRTNKPKIFQTRTKFTRIQKAQILHKVKTNKETQTEELQSQKRLFKN